MLTKNLIVICTISSCSTFGELRKSNEKPQSDSAAASIVVSKPGADLPTISSVDNNAWIQMREAKDNGQDRLNGLLATGTWREAAEEARRELEKTPGDGSLLTRLAAAHALGRNYEMAAYYGGLALKTNPANSDAMNLIGLRLMMASNNRRRDYEEAMSMFQKSLETDGTQVAAALNLGHLQLDLGDTQTAFESFSVAARRCDQCFDAAYGVGLASMRLARWDQAKVTFENILKQDKSKAAAQYQLAIVINRGFNDPNKASNIMQELVSDADGRFKNSGPIKSAANITLRRWLATDRSGRSSKDANQPSTDTSTGDD
jgi:tetratricopeptide (TPR) repeat protein